MTSFYENIPANLSVDLDYANKRIRASLIYANPTLTDVELAKIKFSAVDHLGVPICAKSSFNKISTHNDSLVAVSYGDLGIPMAGKGSVDDNASRLYVTEILHATLLGSVPQLAVDTPYPKRNNSLRYDTKLIVEKGSAVFHGTITSVVNKNRVYFSGDSHTAIDNYSGAYGWNFQGDRLYITNGASSGEYYTIIQDAEDTNNFYVDGDATTLSGAQFKIQPVRYVRNYSGYTADEQVVAQVWVDSPLNHEFGRVGLDGVSKYADIASTSSDAILQTIYSDTDWNALGFGLACSVFSVNKSYFNYSGQIPEVGDILNYRPFTNPSNRVSLATIYKVEDGGSTWRMYIHPSGDPANLPGSDALLIKHNQFDVMNYPDFGSDYIGLVSKSDAVSSSQGGVIAADNFTAPSADLDFSANDYESIYAAITERSHYHVGPIVLSNGKLLDSRDLEFTISLYDGDSTKTTPIKTFNGYGTNRPNAAENYNGQHYRHGVFVGAHDKMFISSETLYLVAEVTYGNATINRTFTIPVQPAP